LIIDTGCNQGVMSYTRDSKGKVVSRHINQQANTIHTATGGGGNTDQFYTDGYKIRRLTPKECFRLMDFPDTFTWPVSDSQAYKQAGNSIVVRVLEKIIKNLPL
jgi:site-specific DNA-cytosine methylase